MRTAYTEFCERSSNVGVCHSGIRVNDRDDLQLLDLWPLTIHAGDTPVLRVSGTANTYESWWTSS